MANLNRVRSYVSSDTEVFDGKDEGGKYVLKEVSAPPPAIEKRRKQCGGCHNDFYNYRMNCTGKSWCWSLENAKNFSSRAKPRCYC